MICLICLLFMSCSQAQNENGGEVVATVATPVVTANQDQETVDYELVFCLDATGSMSGLISTAKEKIWDIVSGISQSQDIGQIKLGMVFYRDHGDNFVTKAYELTTNIDSVYSELLAIGAQGGGDAPESVNASLDEAISKMTWSTKSNAYQTVFLVGDCPPHMDYNEIKYPEICKVANKKGIIINTIKLGTSCQSAVYHFKEIARLTNGSYQQLGQNAKDYVISTPYDDSINMISRKIDESKIYYGSTTIKTQMYSKKSKTLKFYDDASISANSSRATFNGTKAGKDNWFGYNELIQDVNDGKVKLDSITVAYLPDEFKTITKEEQKVLLTTMQTERQQNIAELDALVKAKDKYVRTEKTKNNGKESFSEKVIETMKIQAKR